MRRIRFTLVCLTVLLSGCNEALKDDRVAERRQGKVYIALSSETDSKEPGAKAGKAFGLHTPSHDAIHAVTQITKTELISPYL